jgi:formylglycine-generating enzyme required for sulfatase activity
MAAYTNSLGMEFVEIPPGDFVMGSEKGPLSKPIRRVQMSRFLISKYEVTNAQFERFRKIKRSKYSPDDSMPVMAATRPEILEFIKWLSQKDGRVYLLLTEAQWEYSARGGLENMDFPWGSLWMDGKANIGEKGSGPIATPVGSYEPNGYGLYDMCGNAAEMVRERYYEYSAGFLTNPVGPVIEPSTSEPYILRGLGIGEYMPHVWDRNMSFDDIRPTSEGFRLAIEE